ncbi:MAG: hypothetical protein IJY39_03255 [Clostridia bacterium]|nr:hypothetical protein [Clostridia bacterium]
MTKRKYKNKCRKLFDKANALGVELDFSPEQFEPNKLNCLWHGGWYAYIKLSEDLDIEIGAMGDVCASLFDRSGEQIAYAKDKGNGGYFSEAMRGYIRDDKHLKELLNAGDLVLENNNWIEYGGIYYPYGRDVPGIAVDLGIITDNIVDDDVLNAIDDVLSSLEEIKRDILDHLPAVSKGEQNG